MLEAGRCMRAALSEYDTLSVFVSLALKLGDKFPVLEVMSIVNLILSDNLIKE